MPFVGRALGSNPGRHQGGQGRCRKCCRYIAGSSVSVDISITCSKAHAWAAPEDSCVRRGCFKSKPHACLVRWPEDQGRVHRRLLVNSTFPWAMAQVGIPGAGQGRGSWVCWLRREERKRLSLNFSPAPASLVPSRWPQAQPPSFLPHLQPLRPSSSLPLSLLGALRAAEATRLRL